MPKTPRFQPTSLGAPGARAIEIVAFPDVQLLDVAGPLHVFATANDTVAALRVDAARRMLVETRLPVKRIARRCGFGSEETMRRLFLRLLATTPQGYRARFAA